MSIDYPIFAKKNDACLFFEDKGGNWEVKKVLITFED
jgi:hypothetical protein